METTFGAVPSMKDKILVVDSDPVSLRMARRFFSQHPGCEFYEFIYCSNRSQADEEIVGASALIVGLDLVYSSEKPFNVDAIIMGVEVLEEAEVLESAFIHALQEEPSNSGFTEIPLRVNAMYLVLKAKYLSMPNVVYRSVSRGDNFHEKSFIEIDLSKEEVDSTYNILSEIHESPKADDYLKLEEITSERIMEDSVRAETLLKFWEMAWKNLQKQF